jgi:hypothetical protein
MILRIWEGFFIGLRVVERGNILGGERKYLGWGEEISRVEIV